MPTISDTAKERLKRIAANDIYPHGKPYTWGKLDELKVDSLVPVMDPKNLTRPMFYTPVYGTKTKEEMLDEVGHEEEKKEAKARAKRK